MQLALRTRCISASSTTRQNRTTFTKSLQGRNCAWLTGELRQVRHMGVLQAGDLSFLLRVLILSAFLGVFLLSEKCHVFYLLPESIHGPLQACWCVADAVFWCLEVGKKRQSWVGKAAAGRHLLLIPAIL